MSLFQGRPRCPLQQAPARRRRWRHIDYGASLSVPGPGAHPPDEPYDLGDLTHALAAEGLLAGYEVTQRFYEVGSVEGIRETERYPGRHLRAWSDERDALARRPHPVILSILCRDRPPATTARAGTLAWLGLVAAVLLVVVALCSPPPPRRRLVPYVPLWADQVQYLTEAYRGYDLIRERGLVVGTVDAVRQPRPQGWLLQTVASLVMHGRPARAGPPRWRELCPARALARRHRLRHSSGCSAPPRRWSRSACCSAPAIRVPPGRPARLPAGLRGGLPLGHAARAPGQRERPGGRGHGRAILVGSAPVVTRFISSFYLLPFGAW